MLISDCFYFFGVESESEDLGVLNSKLLRFGELNHLEFSSSKSDLRSVELL